MCNCIEKIQANITEYLTKEGKEVEKVEFLNVTRIVRNLQIIRLTETGVKITFTKGKPENNAVVHTFCPFCGEQYLPEEEVQHG